MRRVTIGVFSTEKRAHEVMLYMKLHVNEFAEYEVLCFEVDVAPVAAADAVA
jgi:hypothetical protein